MNERASFSYCLLQYEHNPWLKERLNIGVLLFCEERQFLRLMTRSWDGRISAAYPNLNKAGFTEDLRQISRAIEKASRSDFRQQSLFSSFIDQALENKRTNLAQKLASMVAPGSDSSYRWNAGGVGYLCSPDEKLRELFVRFVNSYDGDRKRPNRSDENVWSGVSKLLLERNLADRIQSDPVIKTDLGPLKFQAGYQNGTYHVIQPLSFDLSDEDRIVSKAAKWAGFAQSLRTGQRREITAQFLIGRPSNEGLIPSFKSAEGYLRNLVGAENVFEEEQSVSLVDRIAEDLARH